MQIDLHTITLSQDGTHSWARAVEAGPAAASCNFCQGFHIPECMPKGRASGQHSRTQVETYRAHVVGLRDSGQSHGVEGAGWGDGSQVSRDFAQWVTSLTINSFVNLFLYNVVLQIKYFFSFYNFSENQIVIEKEIT